MITNGFIDSINLTLAKYLMIVLALFASTPGFSQDEGGGHEGHSATAALQYGRYIGWIKFQQNDQRLAVVTDIFLESSNDLTKSPQLVAIFKLSLGGYNTNEYFTEKFENILYDFDHGQLTFNEPNKDLVINAEVKQVGVNTVITGQVFVQSSAVSGTLHLQYETDEPGGIDDGPDHDHGVNGASGDNEPPFTPTLDGQYQGQCQDQKVALQIQTIRGLKISDLNTKEPNGLSLHYDITGRIGFDNRQLCPNLSADDAPWCAYYHFDSASYNLYLGKITFHSRYLTQECNINLGALSCQMTIKNKPVDCQLKKVNLSTKPAKFFPRKYQLKPTTDQLQELPPPAPPLNTELSQALGGTYFGFLHNETNDSYLATRLFVIPFSATNNPHNPNQMMITTTATIHLGNSDTARFFSQNFESRSFYLRPGFTLSGPNSDAVMVITEWKTGFVRGEWYSHAFGRVGTVQFVKGSMPTIPSQATIVKNFANEYRYLDRPTIPPRRPKKSWFKLLFPAQPTDVFQNLIKFTGTFDVNNGVTTPEDIELGTFDPYTGIWGWAFKSNNTFSVVSGFIDAENNAQAYWPPASGGGVLMGNYQFETYQPRRQE